jgi:hypothetical protein
MSIETMEVSIKGRMRPVPVLRIDGRTVVSMGRWVKTAAIYDELYVPDGILDAPEPFIARLRQWSARPDIFRFRQKATDSKPRFQYPFEWDNLAVLPITDYVTWLKNEAKRDVKENLRRAAREGVVCRTCDRDDRFIEGIKRLYDETPLRQGRPFWHYGKTVEQVKKDSGHYLDRSEFIGAFYGEELIGFLKMVYVGDIAKTMYVITKESHFHRRPANAMLAKAIEVCAEKGIKYFNYGQYEYPGKKENSLTEFKSRHGFRRFDYPRYYVPLTVKGRVYLALGLHRGLKRLLPTRALTALLKARSAFQHHVMLPARQLVKQSLLSNVHGRG